MNIDPWIVWNSIKDEDVFKLKRKQNSQILNKIFQLDNLLNRKLKSFPEKQIAIKIYIRKKFLNDQLVIPERYKKQLKLINLIELYDGVYQENNVNGAESST
jgi:hypothetical protein